MKLNGMNNVKGGKNMNSKVTIGIIVVGIALIIGYLFYSSGATVSAQGSSSINVEPDEVSVYLHLEGRDSSAQGAKDKEAAISDKVLTELVKLGLERKEIQFVGYNLYPDYDWSNGQQKLKGYIASEQMVIKTKNFDLVPGIVDKGVDAGALVSSINFELSDEKQREYKAQALEEASKDARNKAESTAAGLGKKLGKLVSVNSEQFNYGPVIYYDKAIAESSGMSAENAARNLVPTDIDVTASVSVQYKLRAF